MIAENGLFAKRRRAASSPRPSLYSLIDVGTSVFTAHAAEHFGILHNRHLPASELIIALIVCLRPAKVRRIIVIAKRF